MSNSVRPHRWQPTRLPCHWDSPGKNTGVGCHFLLQYMKVKSESEVAQLCLTLHDPMDCSLPGSSVHEVFQEYWSWMPLPSPLDSILKSRDITSPTKVHVVKAMVFLVVMCGSEKAMATGGDSPPVLLPGKSQGWRSLVLCSPWGC